MKLSIFLLAVVLCVLTSCDQPLTMQTQNPPTGTNAQIITTPAETVPQTKLAKETDVPKISAEESAAMIWNKLPNDLPQGFKKTHLQQATGNATYIEKGKWEYLVLGETKEASILPIQILEKTPGYWVENHSQEVTTRKLRLNAAYFEATDTLQIRDVLITSENKSIQTLSETMVIARKIKLNWIQGSTTGYELRVEGAAKNTGVLPLENIVLEVTIYDYERKKVSTKTETISPTKINVGDNFSFMLTMAGTITRSSPGLTGKVTYGYYEYRFLTTTGQEISLEKK